MHRLPVLNDELVDLAPYVADWLGNATPDQFWPRLTPLSAVDRIKTPALHIAGFNDIFLDGSLRSYDLLRRKGASAAVRDGQYLVVGPWSHANILDWQGDVWLGYGASAPAKDLPGMQLEFFSSVLEGRAPDMARVTYFTSGVNEWRTGEEWPPVALDMSLYLNRDGGLVAEPAQTAAHDRYTSDTLNPVPTSGGATFLPGIAFNQNDGPKPQEQVESRDDVLVFRTEPLDEAVEVTGLVALELWGASTATDCDWTARLVDVDSDGRPLGIVDGVLRSRYRSGSEPTPLTPGQFERFRIDLGHTSHVFRAGHRIGLQVASSNFPRFDRNPQQMVDPVRATALDFKVAEQTVAHGGEYASRLILPVVSLSGATIAPALVSGATS